MAQGDHDSRTAAGDGPLTGTRVLELTTTVAGPFCGRLLADFGAEVIKVEPPGGDYLRRMGSQSKGKSLYAASLFRNKRLVSLDLRTEQGQQAARRLAARCDVVVENFRPGRLEEWGLGYEDLAKDHPALVMVRISGYGQTGPHRERPGYGVIMEAVGGLRHLTGDADRPPARISVPLTDYIAGIYSALGAVMALHHAQRSGQGQVVDTALYEGAFSLMEPYISAYGALGELPSRTGSRLPTSTPNNLYVTGDGKYLLIAAPADSPFRRLLGCMGREDLSEHPHFRTAVLRSRHEDEVDAVIQEWCAGLPLTELEAALHGAGVPATPVLSLADIFRHPQYRARNMLAELTDDDLGTVTVPAPVPRLSATPGKARWPGRRVGEDTLGVLTELAGYSEAEVKALQSAGAAYCAGEEGTIAPGTPP